MFSPEMQVFETLMNNVLLKSGECNLLQLVDADGRVFPLEMNGPKKGMSY